MADEEQYAGLEPMGVPDDWAQKVIELQKDMTLEEMSPGQRKLMAGLMLPVYAGAQMAAGAVESAYKGVKSFGDILQGKEGSPEDITAFLMDIAMGPAGPTEGMAVNKALALKRLGREASFWKKQGVVPKGGYRETLFKPLKRFEQEWYDPLKKIELDPELSSSRLSDIGEEIPSRGEFKPGSQRVIYNPKIMDADTTYHEMLHTRQWNPQTSYEERQLMRNMRNLRMSILDMQEKGAMPGVEASEIYYTLDPTELAAREFATRVRALPKAGSKQIENIFQEVNKNTFENVISVVKERYPEVYKEYVRRGLRFAEPEFKTVEPGASEIPKALVGGRGAQKVPVRGSELGMRLRPEGKAAMEKARRGEKLWAEETESGRMERLADFEAPEKPSRPGYGKIPLKNTKAVGMLGEQIRTGKMILGRPKGVPYKSGGMGVKFGEAKGRTSTGTWTPEEARGIAMSVIEGKQFQPQEVLDWAWNYLRRYAPQDVS